MQYIREENESYNLHIIKTNKFKKMIIKVNFKAPIEKEKIVLRRLVPNILLESNAKYNTKRLLNIKTEELYNLSGGSRVVNSGNSIVTSFTQTALSEKYAKGLFHDTVEFVSNIIFNPIIVDNHFNEEAFKHSRDILKEEMELLNENPMAYANEEAMKEIGKGTPIAYPLYGTEKELNFVKNKDVYRCYLDMINNDKIDIFLIGDIPENASKIVKEYFRFNGLREDSNHYINHKEFSEEYREIKKTKPYNQSTLIIGYKVDNLTNFEKQYVMPIYSYILGGGPDSRLFKNVREKNSLCYSIGSSYRLISNLFIISSGINASDYNKALKLIKEEVRKMANGEFNKNDIEKAKITFLSAYDEVPDSIYSILNDYINHEYLQTDLVMKRKEEIIKVTKEDIMNVIPKIHPEIVYLLEGSKEYEKENI